MIAKPRVKLRDAKPGTPDRENYLTRRLFVDYPTLWDIGGLSEKSFGHPVTGDFIVVEKYLPLETGGLIMIAASRRKDGYELL